MIWEQMIYYSDDRKIPSMNYESVGVHGGWNDHQKIYHSEHIQKVSLLYVI